MASISLKTDQIAYVEEMLRGIKDGAKVALRSAINDTLQRSKGPLAQKLKEKINLPISEIRSRIAITGRPTKDSLTGTLTVSHTPIKLEKFKPVWTKAGGVTVTTFTDGGPHTFGHGFMARMKSGHRGVFQRVKLGVMLASTTVNDLVKAGFEPWDARQVLQRLGSHLGRGYRPMKRAATGGRFPRVGPAGIAWRLPIKDLFGPSAETVLERQPAAMDEVTEDVAARLWERVLSKIDWLLATRGPGDTGVENA